MDDTADIQCWRRGVGRHAVLSFAFILACCAPRAQAQTPLEAWRADLAAIAEELPKRHKNAFAVISKDDFQARVAAAHQKLEGLNDLLASVELAKLVSALGDSHTSLAVPALGLDPLPLRIWRWKDGYFVFRAPREHAAMAGGRIVAVGEFPIDAVSERVRELDACDNPPLVETKTSFRLMEPRTLHALGIVADPKAVPFTVSLPDGRTETFTVRPGPPARLDAIAAPSKTAVSSQQKGWHSHTWLEAEKLLYIHFNACATSKEQDIGAFGDRMQALLQEKAVQTLVIDLQHNGGGNSALGDALFAKLAVAEPMKSRKNLFAVIGRQSFSSAIFNAASLKSRYGFALVGSPTSGTLNHFGEIRSFALPHSKLVLTYSTKRFELGPPDATSLMPDHPAETTFAEWRAGTDRVLETIRGLVVK